MGRKILKASDIIIRLEFNNDKPGSRKVMLKVLETLLFD